MRTKLKRLKKTPADYPQMIFRINQDDKDSLYELIDRVVDLSNRDPRNEGLKVYRKNDVIIDALFIGLRALDKKFTAKK